MVYVRCNRFPVCNLYINWKWGETISKSILTLNSKLMSATIIGFFICTHIICQHYSRKKPTSLMILHNSFNLLRQYYVFSYNNNIIPFSITFLIVEWGKTFLSWHGLQVITKYIAPQKRTGLRVNLNNRMLACCAQSPGSDL